jgi:ParB/RepB/Spo0J family partition protein
MEALPNLQKREIQYIRVDQTENDHRNDVRIKPIYDDSDPDFTLLRNSIKNDGLFDPIKVAENNNNNNNKFKYIIVDGRRRFEAMKQLGYKEVEALIIKPGSEAEIQAIALIQNLHRKQINNIERSTAIAAIFEKVGYSVDQVITNCKRIHNDGNRLDNVDPTFAKIWQTIGYSANFTYQLMQLLRDIPLKIFQYAEKNGLSTSQMILLTHSKLKEHPQIQKELVNELKKTKDMKLSRVVVYQTIRDLETEALFKSGKSYHVHSHLRDKITDKQVEYSPYKHYFEILKYSNALLRNLTGHQITQREYEYNKDHINYSAKHRIDIVKTLNSRDIAALQEQLRILRYAIDSMESVIAGEEQQEVNK